ncbi:ketoacyl-ACP synthase III [Bacteroides fragilis]|nr:ketoacyl-ACP synthase III [Bacteroides fragilis]MCE9228271.1 ketoacyl-ACP synthase III [Bacteroides fragilis]
MAYLEFRNISIAGISAGVPKHVEKTVSTTSKYEAESFIESTGVKEKRYSNDFTTSDLCQAAAERLLDDLKWNKNEIDALIFVSQTPDYILPATSCVLQGKMGFKKECFSLDISLGCSGWVYGLSTLMSLMNGGNIKKALLMVGDARKQAYEEPDQLFGFAGTVTALEYCDCVGSYRFELGTDGTEYDAIIKPEGGTRNQLTERSLDLIECEDGRKRHRLQTRMNGLDVFAFGITTAPKSIKRLGEHFAFDYKKCDYLLLHQANIKMNEAVRKKLQLNSEQVPYSLIDFGNTSSASIPLTIVTQLKGKVENKLTKFVCCGFGVGLSWGTVAFETRQLIISDLVEL